MNIELSVAVESTADVNETIVEDANTQTVSETPVIDIVSTTVQAKDGGLVADIDGRANDAAVIETIVSDEHCGIDSAVASESIRDDIASLDAAVAELNSEVLSLRQESDAKAKLDEIVQAADIASLDAAVEKLNSEVRDLVEQSTGEDRVATSGAIPKIRDNRYFDYSLYRESSTSPPPHPLSTYRWEDIKREKEKVQRELTVNFYSINLELHMHGVD